MNQPTGDHGAATGALPTPALHGAPSGLRSATPGRAGRVLSAVVVVIAIGLAAAWSVVALRQLSSAIARETTDHLVRARTAFDQVRGRTVENLRAHCRMMAEDPRLKTTLVTEGVDEATVADILNDLAKLRRTGFFMIVAPEGRVFAQAGAAELRGLDLSGSSPIKKAQTSPDAVPGSWVIGSKIMDLCVMGMRFGATPIAYLVVGQEVDQDVLKAVTDQTGVAVALSIGDAITQAVAGDIPRAVLAAVAGQPGAMPARLVELEGKPYVAAVAELEDPGQSRPRLVLVQSVAPASASFATIKWMLYVPSLLVLIAVVFAMAASRRTVVVRKS